MANLAGYVQLHKSIRKNPVWKREPFTYGQAFTDLILLAVDAQSAPQCVWIQGEQIVLERGQVGWSISKLADEWHRTRVWVNTFLKWAEGRGMVTVDSNHRRTIITLMNYDAYQPTTGGNTTECTTECTTGNTTDDTHKGKGERGNGKGVKGKDNSPLPEIPDDVVLGKYFAEFSDLARGISGIPEGWWRDWVSYRLDRRQWPADWQTAARMAFLADFANRHPKALGVSAGGAKKTAEKNAGRPDARTPAQARFEISRELEGVRERLDACHEIGTEPSAVDVRREKELERLLADQQHNQ